MSDVRNTESIFVPFCIGLSALVLWIGFQTVQLSQERSALSAASGNQAIVLGNAKKMRVQLDSIAAETAKLAQAGNQNAAQIVEALKQRGVTIDASKAAAVSPK
jgi:regulatory protein YycI of two-component signal transduction system YycFG